MLAALAAQERPDKSLVSALAHRPAYAADMLRPLCHGFAHACAQIRAASLELWHNPKIQCALGKHLAGEKLSILYLFPYAGVAECQYGNAP